MLFKLHLLFLFSGTIIISNVSSFSRIRISTYPKLKIHTCLDKFSQLAHFNRLSLSTTPIDKDKLELQPNDNNIKNILKGGFAVIIIALVSYLVTSGTFSNINISEILQNSISKIESMGPYGAIYFALVIQYF